MHLGKIKGFGSIHDVAERAHDLLGLASERFEVEEVSFLFNDTLVTINRGEEASAAVVRYFTEREPATVETAPEDKHDEPSYLGTTLEFGKLSVDVRITEVLDYVTVQPTGHDTPSRAAYAEFVVEGQGTGNCLVSLDEFYVVRPGA